MDSELVGGGLGEDRSVGASGSVESSVSAEILAKVRAIRGVYASGTWVSGFYKAIHAKHGFPAREAAKERFRVLRKAFPKEQAYLIVGFELGGIFTDAGLMLRLDGSSPIEVGDAAFLAASRASAIAKVSRKLAKVAAIRDELEWVAAHLHEDLPDFGKAPSVTACNMWVSVKTNATFERDFWNAHLKRRQPGLMARERGSPFAEDTGSGEDAGRERDEALERRLGECG